MEYTRLTNLEVTGHLKVAGQEVMPGGGGSSTLSGLTDVDISNPADGQVLVYNAESGKWENGAGGGGGGGGVLVVNVLATRTSDGETVTFDKTFAELKSAYEGGAVMLCHVGTEDNVNGVYGDSIAFLNYQPATQFPIPAPESFFFEATFLQMQSNVHGCFVRGEINADGADALIYTAEWTDIT